MKHSILPLLVATLAGLLCSCVSSADLDRLNPHGPLPYDAEGYISLRGGGCLGPCPMYDIFIFSDGHVVFRGNQHTLLKGMGYTRVPRSRYAELVQMLDSKRVFESKEDGGACITDASAFHLTHVSRDVTRTRLIDHGCENDARDLWPLVELIPRKAGVERWTRYDNLGW